MADFGPSIALKLADEIRNKIREGEIQSGDQIFDALRTSIVTLLSSSMESSASETETAVELEKPQVWMIIGVNGGGKTTTIGKLANRFVRSGSKVMGL